VSAVACTDGGKANFDQIYQDPDPRAYYRGLGSLDYEVPQHGGRVFSAVLDALDVREPTVVDLCSSYGVNAALLKHDLSLEDLYAHYGDDQHADLTPAELAEIDRDFFADRRHESSPLVIGVDVAAPAVDYAVSVGLLDAGHSENLEEDCPSVGLRRDLSTADLITVTGGVGYITERTFDGIFQSLGERPPPWVACLCLRTVSYEPIAECLAGHGLVTERLPDVTFPQRRFADDAERAYALAEVAARGIDPTGREEAGWYHVDVYLSRPVQAVADRPLADVLSAVAACP
jgi:hypothetical protein